MPALLIEKNEKGCSGNQGSGVGLDPRGRGGKAKRERKGKGKRRFGNETPDYMGVE